MAERQFGPYKLIRQIAVGGMAEIHLAKAAGIAGFEKYVALKMIHPNFAEDDQFIEMLVDEAKIAVQLTHGNIAQTFDLGRVGDTYYITMEYVDGADLYKLLRRASEQDVEMPLDLCAFVIKEVASALDHAHRKRDHAGKPLGIVHRDVSPQNVLVSYSGEVKLVDFGIAKATMKVRQTAVGVIKGKYYYMSPEQAWGNPIDHRSDIFSAGIVLYEMITGQMLYLEEDLHKLLDMVRKAEIAPPSKLRKGVPPQLERIVMHALAKHPGERYQSAGDLATDLARFLHTYSPVFTASKLSSLLRQVAGDPIQVPDDPGVGVELRDGAMSTHPLDDSEVAHAIDRDGLRDENSVIFRVSDLDKRATDPAPIARPSSPSQPQPRPEAPPGRPGTPPSAPSSARQSAPRVTRPADTLLATPPPSSRTPPPAPPARPLAKLPQITRPRQIHEETRELEPAPSFHDDSRGTLATYGQRLTWDDASRGEVSEADLDHIGERTLITGAPGMPGFAIDGTGDGDGDGQVEATLVTAAPTGPGFGPESDDEAAAAEPQGSDGDDDDDGPTLSRDFSVDGPTRPASPRPKLPPKAPPPPALAAKIHAPAVSELRKPRPSRRTPAGGSPVATSNVLHAIVASKASEPMPAPRPPPPPPPPAALHPAALHPAALHPAVATPPGVMPQGAPPPHSAMPQGAMPPHGAMPPGVMPTPNPYLAPPHGVTPGAQPSYNHDASGLPMGIPTPPGMMVQPVQGMPYGPPGYAAPPLANQMSQGYSQLSPNAFYPFPPPPQPVSLTGQMRLFEVDEIPSQYKLGAARQRWFTYILSGILAVSVAAGATFLVIRSMRETAPTTGSVRLESVPSGADILFDGARTGQTPKTIAGVVGASHKIRLELKGYEAVEEAIDIPRTGGTVSVLRSLRPLTGKIVVDSSPAGAEIRIDGTLRGRTPMTITGVDMSSAQVLELRLKSYQPYRKELSWKDRRIDINATLQR